MAVPGTSSTRLSRARLGLIALLVAALTTIAAPTASAAAPTEAELVVNTALAQLGDQWKFRARGPNRFDCSGLVFFSFNEHGLKLRIGGYRSTAGYFKWFRAQGRLSRTNPHLGDLVVWGRNQHMGIYIGNGKAVSTLVTKRGVAVHAVKGYLNLKFRAYLHVDLTRPGDIPEESPTLP